MSIKVVHPNRKVKPKREYPERDLQCQCYEWFHHKYPNLIFFQIPNEATARRSIYYAQMGTCSGFPDCGIVFPNEVVFIEFKAPKPYRSHVKKEQKEIGDKIRFLLGADKHYFCYSFDEFKEIIEQHIES